MPRKFDWGRVFAGAGKGLAEGLPRGIEYGIGARTRAQTTREKAQKAAQDVADLLRKREEEYYKTIGYEPRIPGKPAMPGYTPTFIPRLQGKLAIGGIPGAGRVIPPQELIMPGPGPMQKTPMVPSRYPTFEEYQAGEHIWAPKSPKSTTLGIKYFTLEEAIRFGFPELNGMPKTILPSYIKVKASPDARGMLTEYQKLQVAKTILGDIGLSPEAKRIRQLIGEPVIEWNPEETEWAKEEINKLLGTPPSVPGVGKETPGQKDFGKKYGY